MSSIGTLSFTAWKGTIQPQSASVETFTRAGVDGTGLLVGAVRGVQSAIETVNVDTLVNVAADLDDAKAMVGTVVTAVDDSGTTFSNTAVISVSGTIKRCGGVGSSTHMLTMSWQLLAE